MKVATRECKSSGIPVRRRAAFLFFPILFAVSLSGCSSVTNTIAGLTTPQSTISGSTYPFWVNAKTNRLTPELPSRKDNPGGFIKSGDYFTVFLDFGFLRYLQAVDPYVIVYAETWVSSSPRPEDSAKTLRQIVLRKEGVSQNARVPDTAIPLLGPITYEKDTPYVYVTLKVVVLSKYDNAETIKLVEGLGGVISTPAPHLKVAAGAAADVVATFISQNRDKIEFEHSFALSPEPPAGSVMGDEKEDGLFLKEGTMVLLKGEDSARVVL